MALGFVVDVIVRYGKSDAEEVLGAVEYTFVMPAVPILLARDGTAAAALRLFCPAFPGALTLRFLPKISAAMFAFLRRRRSAEMSVSLKLFATRL